MSNKECRISKSEKRGGRIVEKGGWILYSKRKEMNDETIMDGFNGICSLWFLFFIVFFCDCAGGSRRPGEAQLHRPYRPADRPGTSGDAAAAGREVRPVVEL